jgi:hypothetical protein
VCVALAKARHSASMANRYVKGAIVAVVSSGLMPLNSVVASGDFDAELSWVNASLHAHYRQALARRQSPI